QAGRCIGVVEEPDATPEQRAINEINAGLYLFDLAGLRQVLPQLSPANRQQEFYLTDAVGSLAARGLVATVPVADPEEILGVNDRIQLARAEKILRRRILEYWMAEGVTVVDPDTTFVGEEVRLGQDTVLLPFTFLEGQTTLGRGCRIGPNARMIGSRLGDGVEVQMAVLVEAHVGDRCQIGPFAYLRPGARLAERVKVGDFVEIKNSSIGAGSKVPHLSYVGDATVGAGVNLGAGTITATTMAGGSTRPPSVTARSSAATRAWWPRRRWAMAPTWPPAGLSPRTCPPTRWPSPEGASGTWSGGPPADGQRMGRKGVASGELRVSEEDPAVYGQGQPQTGARHRRVPQPAHGPG